MGNGIYADSAGNFRIALGDYGKSDCDFIDYECDFAGRRYIHGCNAGNLDFHAVVSSDCSDIRNESNPVWAYSGLQFVYWKYHAAGGKYPVRIY